MTGDPWRRLFARARERGPPWESVPPWDDGSLSPSRLAAPCPHLPSRLHVAVAPAPGYQGQQRRMHQALSCCTTCWADGTPQALSAGIAGLWRDAGSVGWAHSRSFPLLLGDGACRWRERLVLALWYYFNFWTGWECGAFPLANDILRISLLSNYSWFRHLEAREQVWIETSHQVSVIKGTGSLFKDRKGDPKNKNLAWRTKWGQDR